MAAPLLPLLLLGGGLAVAIASSKKKDGPQPSGTLRTYILDSDMPSALRDQVVAALASERDPTKLDQFATGIAAHFPLSAKALHGKAMMLAGGTLPENPLDMLASVPDPVRSDVVRQLMQQTDPDALESYAAQLEVIYPAAAAALRMKEQILRGQLPVVDMPKPTPAPPPIVAQPAPQPPAQGRGPSVPPPTLDQHTTPPSAPAGPIPTFAPPPTSMPSIGVLDPGIPAEVQKAVLNAIATEHDPAKLDAFANAIRGQYPIAAGLLSAKANGLRLAALPVFQAPSAPQQSGAATGPFPTPGTPTTAPVPGQATPSPATVPPILSGIDLNAPPEIQKAVLGALTTESDPTKLEGFASAIQSQYPIAAGLLTAKAKALRLAAQAVPTTPAPSPRSPAASQPAPIPQTQGGSVAEAIVTYKVKQGDSAWKITQTVTGNGNRWKELVSANPTKKTGKDGNFASLMPGEPLRLPPSWTSHVMSTASPVASLPVKGGSNAAHA